MARDTHLLRPLLRRDGRATFGAGPIAWIATLIFGCSASPAKRPVATPEPAPLVAETPQVPALSESPIRLAAIAPDVGPESVRADVGANTGPETFAPVRYEFHESLPGPGALSSAPARRYANLSASQCRAELRKRALPTKPAGGSARGVATPVRVTGPLGGVRFLAPGTRSVYGMLDCRLVLVLADFGEFLEKLGVAEVLVDNLYRPRARLPGRRGKRSQHAYGLAIDIMGVRLQDGRDVLVERDWEGDPSLPPCGPESESSAMREEAILLRNIVCGAARAGLFHHLLTPNYDEAHRDHLHLDIKRDARAIVVR